VLVLVLVVVVVVVVGSARLGSARLGSARLGSAFASAFSTALAMPSAIDSTSASLGGNGRNVSWPSASSVNTPSQMTERSRTLSCKSEPNL